MKIMLNTHTHTKNLNMLKSLLDFRRLLRDSPKKFISKALTLTELSE